MKRESEEMARAGNEKKTVPKKSSDQRIERNG
jgi:hypothetical protein